MQVHDTRSDLAKCKTPHLYSFASPPLPPNWVLCRHKPSAWTRPPRRKIWLSVGCFRRQVQLFCVLPANPPSVVCLADLCWAKRESRNGSRKSAVWPCFLASCVRLKKPDREFFVPIVFLAMAVWRSHLDLLSKSRSICSRLTARQWCGYNTGTPSFWGATTVRQGHSHGPTLIWEPSSCLLMIACWALRILLCRANSSLKAAGLIAPWRRLWTTSVRMHKYHCVCYLHTCKLSFRKTHVQRQC